MKKTALIVGATGLSGSYLAKQLKDEGDWRILGLSRSGNQVHGVDQMIAVDLSDAKAVQAKVGAYAGISHVFFCTWTRKATEAENCVANRAMVKHVLDAVSGEKLVHVALVTGTKHYLGPFENYAKGKPYTPFQEDQPRLPGLNFYYDQEDEIFAASDRMGFRWSVHRPHTMIGFALGNAMNMAVTLAVYASVCKEEGRPFLFPGSKGQYEAVADITDARLLARHLSWAATRAGDENCAYNVVNGDLFRWYRMWERIGGYFGLKPAEYPGHPTPLEQQMADVGPVWDKIVAKYGLAPHGSAELASWWHSDSDLGRDVECFNDMKNSRQRGFMDWQHSEQSFFDVFDRLIAEKIIPDFRPT